MFDLTCSVGSFALLRDFGLSFHSGRRILKFDPAQILIRSSTMLRRIPLCLALTAALLPAAVFAQSQDTQSVAEAARRAREQKKAQAKPAKVITEDDVKPAAQSNPATPASPDAATAPGTPSQPASSTASTSTASSSTALDAKGQKDSKEVTELKAQIKQVQGDLDLLQREQSLEQDKYYSNADYVHDTAGKAKLEALKQQVSDKQQELEHLKTRLAALQPTESDSTSTPPKP